MLSLSIRTESREQFVNVTGAVRDALAGTAWSNGALLLFCPHTTCGLTVNEGADPDVVRDMTRFFSETIPRRNNWRHAEGNSDAHLKSSLLGCSLLLPVEDGALRLGTWQSVYLFEGDGPRARTLWLQWLPGEE